MSLEELKYNEVMQRLDALNKVDIDERFNYIEKQLGYFNLVCGQILKSFEKGINIKVDEQSMNVINPLKEILMIMKTEALTLQKLREELQSDSVIGTLQFMAKKLHELTQEVHSIKENGVKKAIHLALTMDGYEMTKKKPPAKLTEDDLEEKVNDDEPVQKLLKTLTDREAKVLTHAYGFLGEKKKTAAATGKLLGVTGMRIRQLQEKSLRKCRHPSRRELIRNIANMEFRYDTIGE